MRLEVRGQHLEVTEAVHTHATRRLQFVLGRFGQRIARVTVHLTALNGPRGGRDKHCSVVAAMRRGGKVTVEDTDAALYVAIAEAADRLGRAVARVLERQREH